MASRTLLDSNGESFYFHPSCSFFTAAPTSQVEGRLCDECGCFPCILSYFPGVDDDYISAEELMNCQFFPYVPLYGLWQKYLCSFGTSFPSLKIPITKFSTRLANAVAFVNGVVLPAVEGLHRLFEYAFPNEVLNFVEEEYNAFDFSFDADKYLFQYHAFAHECQEVFYTYGEMCVFLARNVSYQPNVSSKTSCSYSRWLTVVESVQKDGNFQALLQQVERAKQLHPGLKPHPRLYSADELPKCVGVLGHITYVCTREIGNTEPPLVAFIHPEVNCAPWQIDPFKPFEGYIEVTRAFAKACHSLEPWTVRAGVVAMNYSPFALDLETGVRPPDGECSECLVSTSAEFRSYYHHELVEAHGMEEYFSRFTTIQHSINLDVLTGWFSTLLAERCVIQRLSDKGVYKCRHFGGDGMDFDSYIALRDGLSHIPLKDGIQVKSVTLSDILFKGGANALSQALCAPTTACCGLPYGPACNEMGVMIR